MENAPGLANVPQTQSDLVERVTVLEALIERELETMQAQIRRLENELSATSR